MDINYLLFLQDFRNGVGSVFETFFLKMSYLGEMNIVLTIMAAIYWFVLIAFSRNYLGVHTPQDVIVGVLDGPYF